MITIKQILSERADDYVVGAAKKAGSKLKQTATDTIGAGQAASFKKEAGKLMAKLVDLVREKRKLGNGVLREAALQFVEMTDGGEQIDEGIWDFIKGAGAELGRKFKTQVNDIRRAGREASEQGDIRRAEKREQDRKQFELRKIQDLDNDIKTTAVKFNDLLRRRVEQTNKKFRAADIKSFIDHFTLSNEELNRLVMKELAAAPRSLSESVTTQEWDISDISHNLSGERKRFVVSAKCGSVKFKVERVGDDIVLTDDKGRRYNVTEPELDQFLKRQDAPAQKIKTILEM